MKVCIAGAGSIGGLIGARLGAAGIQLSALARGATLEALQRHGMRAQIGEQIVSSPVKAVSDAAQLGVQDGVILAVKGPALPAIARAIAPLLGPETVVISAMNGVPWWFFDGFGGPCQGMRIEAVDPGDVVGTTIASRTILGCVVHLSASAPQPGLSRLHMGNGLILGEPSGQSTPRLAQWVDLLSRAGFEASASAGIQRDIWYKLWGNMTINPVSALTGATGDRILDDQGVRDFCSAVMGEAASIGARIGCAIDQAPEARHAITRKLGAFKTSMLQDVEAGRTIELDALVTAVQEIGRKLGLPTPAIDTLLGLSRLFGRVRGIYP